MKLAYLVNFNIPSRTASSIHVMKMCQAFSEQGHSVNLIMPDSKKIEPDVKDINKFYDVGYSFGIQKFFYPSCYGQSTFATLHAAWLINKIDPEILYTRSLDYCYRVNRFVNTPFILEMHVPINKKGKKQLDHLIGLYNFKYLIVITKSLKKWYLDNFPALAGRIYVYPDGADLPKYGLLPVKLKRDKRLVVGYCGQLYDGKGMEIIAELATIVREVDFHIVGGSEKDILRWKKRLSDVENVFFHGFMPVPMAQRYIASFDVALAPYKNKVTIHGGGGDIANWMSPLKIFEYMSHGKPIITTDLPVLKEVLKNGETALMCDHDDIQAWRKALLLLLDKDKREMMGRLAFKDFEANYTWKQRANNVLEKINTDIQLN